MTLDTYDLDGVDTEDAYLYGGFDGVDQVDARTVDAVRRLIAGEP